jgi:hypothetical protein
MPKSPLAPRTSPLHLPTRSTSAAAAAAALAVPYALVESSRAAEAVLAAPGVL